MREDYSLGTVEVSQSPPDRFEEYLQSRGLRNTKQRRFIVEQVFAQHEHFDADELMATLAVASGKSPVSRPTVYRMLAELVEAGLLRKMELGGRSVYEHDYGYPQHDHLHCQKCNALIEFRSESLKQIRNQVAQDHNFHVTGHRFIITGVCDDCRKQNRRKKTPLDLV